MPTSAISSIQAVPKNYGLFPNGIAIGNANQLKSSQPELAQARINDRCIQNIQGSCSHRYRSILPAGKSLIGCATANFSGLSFSHGVGGMPAILQSRLAQAANSEINNTASNLCRIKASSYSSSTPRSQQSEDAASGSKGNTISDLQGSNSKSVASNSEDIKEFVSFIEEARKSLRECNQHLKQFISEVTIAIETYVDISKIGQPKELLLNEKEVQVNEAAIDTDEVARAEQKKPTEQKHSGLIQIQNIQKSIYVLIAKVTIQKEWEKRMEDKTVCLQPMMSLYEALDKKIKKAKAEILTEGSNELEAISKVMEDFANTVKAFEAVRDKLYYTVYEASDQLPDQENKNI